jgi:hypothetical protein
VSTIKSLITSKQGSGARLRDILLELRDEIESKHKLPGRTILPFTEMAVFGSLQCPSLNVRLPSCVPFIDLRVSKTDIFPGSEHNQVSFPLELVSGS